MIKSHWGVLATEHVNEVASSLGGGRPAPLEGDGGELGNRIETPLGRFDKRRRVTFDKRLFALLIFEATESDYGDLCAPWFGIPCCMLRWHASHLMVLGFTCHCAESLNHQLLLDYLCRSDPDKGGGDP